MEGEENESMRKRMRQSVEDERMVGDETVVEIVGEDAETGVPLSEQMQGDITHILEKIDRFTQLVSELMESGKTLLQELSNDFEERLITLHKEQMEIWQEEIKKLRSLDASNEDINATLQNARLLLHHVQSDS